MHELLCVELLGAEPLISIKSISQAILAYGNMHLRKDCTTYDQPPPQYLLAFRELEYVFKMFKVIPMSIGKPHVVPYNGGRPAEKVHPSSCMQQSINAGT